jgi:hypothetical protein
MADQPSEAHRERRSLRYIRLAAWLADQPSSVDRLTLSRVQIEELIGESLPPVARFPSWWRNDARKAHSRAWMTAGWWVDELNGEGVVFTRNGGVPHVE